MRRASPWVISSSTVSLLVSVSIIAGCAEPTRQPVKQADARSVDARNTAEKVSAVEVQKPIQKAPAQPAKAEPVAASPEKLSPTAVADAFDKGNFVKYRGKVVTWQGKVDSESDPSTDFVVVVLADEGADGHPCNYVAAVKMASPLNSAPAKNAVVLVRGVVSDIFTEAWWTQGTELPGRIINRSDNNDLPPVMKGTDGKTHRTVCFQLRDGQLAATR